MGAASVSSSNFLAVKEAEETGAAAGAVFSPMVACGSWASRHACPGRGQGNSGRSGCGCRTGGRSHGRRGGAESNRLQTAAKLDASAEPGGTKGMVGAAAAGGAAGAAGAAGAPEAGGTEGAAGALGTEGAAGGVGMLGGGGVPPGMEGEVDYSYRKK